jgi:hypothetical protein
MNLHGAPNTWPVDGQHYFLTDGPYDGARYGVWSWSNPFAGDVPINHGTVDLYPKTLVTAGAPIDAPQKGGNPKLDGNDWRVQDAEYRNGFIWMTNTIACNPGGGTVDCVRWAKIDPTGPSVSDAGVYGSPGEYRIFADLAVDDCNNMAVGYTKTSSAMYPAVFVSGRESSDLPGYLQAEVPVKAGAIHYTSFQSGTTHRWGDYTAMTIDPDGKTFWYMGQYSKDTGTTSGRWGNWIAPFSFASCDGNSVPLPGKASNLNPASSATTVSINTDLSWTAGSGASSHDVYFGTDSSPDNTSGQSEFMGSQTSTSYALDTLDYSTTYYWRIDEINTTGTTMGTVWSFTTEADPNPSIPGQASIISPANGGTSIAIDASLSWNAGTDATSHDVYFGTSSTPARIGNQTGTTYNPGALSYDTIYYWRINEVNTTGTKTGALWSFTTQAQPTLVGSSTSQGKTWTAIVSGTNIHTLGGMWVPEYGAPNCSENQCSMDNIPKKESQVTFDPADDAFGGPVVILKP